MIKLDFKGNVVGLNNHLNAGDIIEVCLNEVAKIVRVTVEDGSNSHCSRCVFSEYGRPCRFLIMPTYVKNPYTAHSPCNTKLLDDGKEYKYKFCMHYEDISCILEEL